jgi:hypothetical protein
MFNIIKKLLQWLFGTDSQKRIKIPPVRFQTITIVSKTPSNQEVYDKDFILVIFQNKPVWALFRCPCGCQHVISLSLQRIHKPHWTVTKTKDGRPLVYPSIWQIKNCHSHFWIKDGRIYWV